MVSKVRKNTKTVITVVIAVLFALLIGLFVGGIFSDILTIIHRLATGQL